LNWVGVTLGEIRWFKVFCLGESNSAAFYKKWPSLQIAESLQNTFSHSGGTEIEHPEHMSSSLPACPAMLSQPKKILASGPIPRVCRLMHIYWMFEKNKDLPEMGRGKGREGG